MLLICLNYSFKFSIGTQLLFFSAYPVADRINAACAAARNTNQFSRTAELIHCTHSAWFIFSTGLIIIKTDNLSNSKDCKPRLILVANKHSTNLNTISDLSIEKRSSDESKKYAQLY